MAAPDSWDGGDTDALRKIIARRRATWMPALTEWSVKNRAKPGTAGRWPASPIRRNGCATRCSVSIPGRRNRVTVSIKQDNP